METNLSNVVEITTKVAKYDASVKKVLADKQVLSRILKYSLEEFKDIELEDIIKSMDEPVVSGIRMEPGQTNLSKIVKYSEEVAELGDKKRINALLLEKYLKDKCAFEWINNKKNPYAMTLYMNKEERKKAWECVNKLGEVTYTWPDINPLFKEDINLYNLKDSMLHIAVHDGMTPGYIYRKLKKNESISMQKPVTIYEVLSDEYKKLCQHAEKPIPLLQSNIYAEAKSRTQGWKEQYWVVKSGNEIVAFFLTLKKYGFVYRINRGPYLTDENYKMETYNIIQKKFGKKGRILFFAPEDQQTGESINEMLQAGYKYRKCYFSTGYIDLSMPENFIKVVDLKR